MSYWIATVKLQTLGITLSGLGLDISNLKKCSQSLTKIETFRNNPRLEQGFEDELGRVVGDEVEVDGVAAIKEDALDQCHHASGAVEARAHDPDLEDFAFGNTGFLNDVIRVRNSRLF